MRLVLANDAFHLHGVHYAGFPIILDGQMRIVEEAHAFLVHACLRSGRARSKASWERYGRDLYDFFGFVLTNQLDWKSRPAAGYTHPAEAYRDWALNECRLKRSTINGRLSTILRFYDWAARESIIDGVPFETTRLQVRPIADSLSYTDSRGGIRKSSNLLLRQTRGLIKLLTLEQCKVCLATTVNQTHRLMFRLALQTGLRSTELRSFPASYVFDPDQRADLRAKSKVRLLLSPADGMRLKGDSARAIDLPLPLMADLWHYFLLERPRRQNHNRIAQAALFLTEHGRPYARQAIEKVFNALSRRAGFHVTPHMLRHTYATYTLHGLRERGFKGEALMYLRDRLGHRSLSTTMIYLHLLEQMDAELMLLHEAEIDSLMRG